MPDPCPTREQLHDYAIGLLPEDVAERLTAHLAQCPRCEETIAHLDGTSDTLLSALSRQDVRDSVLEEPQLKSVLSLIEAIGINPVSIEDADTPDVATAPLERVGGYELIAQLGRGGMGTVYKARHTKLDKIVALKVLPAVRMQNAEAVNRFEREMKAVGKLCHPNIVAAHDAGEIDGTHYLVMELVDGLDLSTLLRAVGAAAGSSQTGSASKPPKEESSAASPATPRKAMTVADACELVRQAAVGLQEAHEHGMVHRDIKPSNLMLARQRHGKPLVKILDLGLALLDEANAADRRELTTTGQLMGTLDYMAPEQGTDSHSVDIRADIYALGATLFKLLVGRVPFSGDTPLKLMMAKASKPAPSVGSVRDDLPAELVAVVDRMLALDPADRYARPADVAEALAPFCAESDLAELLKQATAEGTERLDDQSAIGTHNSLQSESAETDRAIRSEPALRGSASAGREEPLTAAPISEQQSARAGRSPAAQVTKPLTYAQRWIRRPPIAIATALAGIAGLIALGVILTLKTPYGTVEVRLGEGVSADDVQIEISQGDRLHLIDKNNNWQIDLEDGRWNVRLKSGNERFTIDKRAVTVRRHGKELVSVTLKNTDGGQRSPAASADAERQVAEGAVRPMLETPDRRAAEWVLSIGGRIRVDDQDRDITTAADLPQEPFLLTYVWLGNNTQVTDAGLSCFAGCKSLTYLDLSGCRQVTDAGLAYFAGCKDLTHLGLNDCAQVTDAGLAYFADCKKLTYLSVYSRKVTDTGLAYFADCKELTLLSLVGTQVTDAGLAYFAGCKKLTYLHLGYCRKVTDAGLAHFADCKDLTLLSLDGCPQVTDAGLANFRDCKKLAELYLAYTQVTDAGLAQFKGCEDLTSLSLYGCAQVSDAALAHFKERKNLINLKLGRTQVTDGAIADFPRYKNLRSVNLDGCTQITNAGLAHLGECRNLTNLSLDHCAQVNDASLEVIAGFSRLATLRIVGTKVTAAGVAKLQKDLPKCEITWEGDNSADADREVAEWVLGVGGEVRFVAQNQIVGISAQHRSAALRSLGSSLKRGTAKDVPPGTMTLFAINLSGIELLRDDDLHHLLRLKGLKTLDVSLTSLTDASTEFLGQLTALNDLRLAGVALSDAGVARLKPLRGLVGLELESQQITDVSLPVIAEFKNLTMLSMPGTAVTDAGLVHLERLEHLTSLNLLRTRVTDRGLKHIAVLSHLQKLYIGGSPPHGITDEGVAQLRTLEDLRELRLVSDRVSDRGVEQLSKLPRLEILFLDYSRMTDEGLKHLQRAKKLRYLSVKETKVTAAGVARLQQALPNCKILSDYSDE